MSTPERTDTTEREAELSEAGAAEVAAHARETMRDRVTGLRQQLRTLVTTFAPDTGSSI